MIALLGLDHRDAGAQVRGRLAFAEERLAAALRALAAAREVAGAAILSTCNRTEIYLATGDWPAARAAAVGLLGAAYERAPAGPLPPPAPTQGGRSRGDAPGLPEEVERALYAYEGAEAARRLFLVAAGLRSMIVGEAQILGQVKDALLAAETAGTLDEELRAAFTQAIKVGKRVRSETEIGRADVSVARVAVRVAGGALGGLAGKTALLIGAGRTSQLCAGLARDAGAERLLFANRTESVAAEVARAIGGEPVPLGEIAEWLPRVDLVVSATAAPHVILTAEAVARATADRSAPLVIVDLAVPPDVEAAVGRLPGVALHTLDDLRGAGDEAEESAQAGGRAGALAHAERIVDEGVREYVRGQALRLAVPGIAALRRHVDRSAEAELERALGRLGDLSPAERQVVEQLGHRLVDKMFHHLVARVRSLAEYDEVPPQVTMRVLARLLADPDDRATG